MSTFTHLSPDLQARLIRCCPGAVIRVPKRAWPSDNEVLVAVITEIEAGRSETAACYRVARRMEISERTARRICAVRRREARGGAPRMDPEYGGR